MDKRIQKCSATLTYKYAGKYRFEHWYVDNQVYFITARCRDKYPAFQPEQAKTIFWDRFNFYCKQHQFFPWVVSLMNNHYHVVGYIAGSGPSSGR